MFINLDIPLREIDKSNTAFSADPQIIDTMHSRFVPNGDALLTCRTALTRGYAVDEMLPA
jgi:hypothetical protein